MCSDGYNAPQISSELIVRLSLSLSETFKKLQNVCFELLVVILYPSLCNQVSWIYTIVRGCHNKNTAFVTLPL